MATEYGTRLRAARKHAGLTQQDLSQKTGIPQSTISTAERMGGKSTETVTYAQACGVDAAWLANGDGAMLPGPSQSTSSVGGSLSIANTSPGPSLANALEVLAASLNELPDARRELAAQHLQTLARAPDSKRAREALLSTMLPAALGPAMETVDFAGKPKADDATISPPAVTAQDFVKK